MFEHACLNIPPQDALLGAEAHDEGLDMKDNIATSLIMRALKHYVWSSCR